MSSRAGAWLALLLPLSAAVAAADEETFLGCREIPSAEARLACYDRVVDRTRARLSPGPDEAPLLEPPRPTAAERPLRERVFGRPPASSTLQKAYGVETPDSIEAHAVAIDRGADRLLLVTLDNGQVWRQAEPASFLIREGDVVSIKAGALGAYYLRSEGRGRSIRVNRIR